MRPAAVAARARIMRASHVTDVGVTRDRYGSEGGRIHTSLGGRGRGNAATRIFQQNERYLLSYVLPMHTDISERCIQLCEVVNPAHIVRRSP